MPGCSCKQYTALETSLKKITPEEETVDFISAEHHMAVYVQQVWVGALLYAMNFKWGTLASAKPYGSLSLKRSPYTLIL